MKIRRTIPSDLDRIMEIYDKARAFMVASGNPNQWVAGYPTRQQIETDIEQGKSCVCLDDARIVATFYFAVEAEPAYATIDQGRWLNDEPYGVVHRIAVDSQQKGTATFCLAWCFAQIGNIRIDTHEDNIPMQKVLQKSGYTACGRITLANGSTRLAFQKSRDD